MNKSSYIVSIILALFLSASATAQVGRLDGISAIVEEDVVLASEVDKRLSNVMQQLEGNPALSDSQMAELRKQVVEQLIIETIQIQMARRSGIRLDDNMLNQAMTEIANQNGLDFNTFRAALENQGIYNETREQIAREFVINQFQTRAVNQRINITRQEIENYLRSEAGVSSIQPEYHVAHILIPQRNDGQEERRKELADLLFQRIDDGENIVALAASGSVLGLTVSGGDLGWNKVETLPSLFSGVVPDLTDGEISEPFSSPSGFHLVQVLETRGGVTLSVPQTHIRHILIAPNEIRTEQQAEVLINELHERIVNNGEDFADIARQNTDDYGSIVSGGDLDWISPDQLPQAFYTAMDKLDIDEISEPFLSETGWHIIQVLGRRTRDLTEENKRYRAEQILRNRKYEMELQNWLTEIRDEAYTEIIDE